MLVVVGHFAWLTKLQRANPARIASPSPHRHIAIVSSPTRVQVQAVIPEGHPSEPCLEPETLRWLDEVRQLLSTHANLSHTAAEATGYRELIDHLNGKLTLDEATEQIKIATRQLARRQMKWFRRFRDVNWIPGDRSPSDIASEVFQIWRGPLV